MSVKEVVVLQAMQEGKKEVNEKLVEHPLKQDFLGSQDLAVKIKIAGLGDHSAVRQLQVENQ